MQEQNATASGLAASSAAVFHLGLGFGGWTRLLRIQTSSASTSAEGVARKGKTSICPVCRRGLDALFVSGFHCFYRTVKEQIWGFACSLDHSDTW